MIVAITNKTRSRIDIGKLEKLTADFLTKHRLRRQEVEIVLIGDTLMRRLNKQYRGLDRATDVLSFCEQDSLQAQPNFLGQIMIDYQQIRRQAKSLGHSAADELSYIVVHGLLHLLGYDDRTDQEAQKMDQLALRFLQNKKLRPGLVRGHGTNLGKK